MRPEPIPFSFSLPASFKPGQQVGNVRCITDNTARITLSPPIQFDRQMEGHLVQASMPFSQPNIGGPGGDVPGVKTGNNRISITWPGVDGGNGLGARFNFYLPQGLYGLQDVEDALNYLAFALPYNVNPAGPIYGLGITDDFTDRFFQLSGVAATQQIIMGFDPTVTGLPGGAFPAGASFDFLNPSAPNPFNPSLSGINDSLGPVLGFLTTAGNHPAGGDLPMPAGQTTLYQVLSVDRADLAIYSAYVMYMSCLRDNYNNGLTGQLLYTFNIGGRQPNSIMSFNPSLVTPVPVATGSFSSIDVWFTDDQGNNLKLANFDGSVTVNVVFAKTKEDGSV